MSEVRQKFSIKKVYGYRPIFEITKRFDDGSVVARDITDTSNVPIVYCFHEKGFEVYEQRKEIVWL
jgi:hypothetical protein